ncbi:MAG: hypothetical protein Roseis2KO_30380 [Roseivirga sp.]
MGSQSNVVITCKTKLNKLMKMQKMKNLMMLVALALTVTVMSCDENLKEDTMPVDESQGVSANSRLRVLSNDTLNTTNMNTWVELRSSDFPQEVTDYLTANYDGVNIEESWRTDEGQIVILLENDVVLIFSPSGELLIALDLGDFLDDEEEDWVDIEISDLPQVILDYVATNYPDATIDEAGKDPENGDFIVLLDNDLILIFDKDGVFLEVWEDDEDDDWEEIDIANLPQAILDYVAANYPTATIDDADVNTEDGSFAIFLDTDLVLIFDKDGNFLEEMNEDDYDEDDLDEIDPADLPQAIKDYIAANHASATIEEAESDPEDGTIYVLLDSGLVLVFDANGTYLDEFEEWEEECVAVPVADLLQAIKDYVATNYPDRTIAEAWYNPEDKEYYVELDDETVLVFDEAGVFIEVLD